MYSNRKEMTRRTLTEAEINDIIDNVLDYNYYTLTRMPDGMRTFYTTKIKRFLVPKLATVLIHPSSVSDFRKKVLQLFRRIDSGTAVGVICGQSIGEKHTQMKLNTFHKAGLSDRNTSQDAPRFLEILDTNQSAKQSARCCFLYLKERPKSIQRAQEIIGSDVVALYFKTLVVSWDTVDPTTEYDWYLGERVPDEPGTAVLHFDLNLFLLYKYTITLEQIQQRMEECIQEIPFHVYISPLFMGKIALHVPEMYADAIQSKLFKCCFFGLKGIDTVFYIKEGDEWYIETDGSNLQEVLKLEYVDGFRTYSNDFWEMYTLFGIDTVRQYLVHELNEILTDIHLSHKTLLIDRMTLTGKLKSMTRYTRKNEQSSVFSKATFEETLNIFSKAALTREVEDVRGVSAAIICSKVSSIGTGMNELVYQ
jgi:DNA-directed RNA polymerase beta' subunit